MRQHKYGSASKHITQTSIDWSTQQLEGTKQRLQIPICDHVDPQGFGYILKNAWLFEYEITA